MLIPVRRARALAALAGVCGLASGVAAEAAASELRVTSAPRAAASGHAPVGAPVDAPRPFLDFCRRTPADCVEPGTSAAPADMEVVKHRAAALFWAQVFDMPAEAAPAAGPVAVASTAFDWSRVFPARASRVPAAADGVLTAEDLAAVAPEGQEAVAVAAVPVLDAEAAPEAADFGHDAAAAEPARLPTIVTDKAVWRRINQINRRVNRAIRRGADARLYGQADYWAAPTGRGAQGDCEDYVLAKRRELIREGFPAEALSIAIVDTAKGERHAVLLIATDQGEFVLDNLSSWISRWDKVDYHWLQRQAPGRVFDWVGMDA